MQISNNILSEAEARRLKRSDAMKRARNEVISSIFTYASAVILCAAFCLAVCFSLVFLVYLERMSGNRDTFPYIVAGFFICYPAVRGLRLFVLRFSRERRRDYTVIFRLFRCPARCFGKTLSAALYMASALFPFALLSSSAAVMTLPRQAKLFCELISLLLLWWGFNLIISAFFGGSRKKGASETAVAFTLHIIIAILTKGLYLIFLFPYMCLSFGSRESK